MQDLLTGFYGKTPFSDTDYYGVSSLNETVNFFDLAKAALADPSSFYLLPQDVLNAISGYLDRLDNSEEMGATDKMK